MDIPLIYIIFPGEKKKKNPKDWQCPVPVLSYCPAVYAEGCLNLRCHSIDLSHVFSKCSLASRNLFIVRNLNLSSRVIKSVFPPSQLPVWFYDIKHREAVFHNRGGKCIVNGARGDLGVRLLGDIKGITADILKTCRRIMS